MEHIILLVEENVEDAAVAVQSFRTNGLAHRVHVALDGHEALDFLLSARSVAERGDRHTVLVLLSLSLPRISGVEVLRRIKSDHRTEKIPVIALGAPGSDLEVQTTMNLMKFRADSFIEKPITFDKLFVAAKQLGIHLNLKA